MERQRETCLGQSKSERTNITERNSNERLVNENDTRKRFFFSLVADNILHFCSLLIISSHNTFWKLCFRFVNFGILCNDT